MMLRRLGTELKIHTTDIGAQKFPALSALKNGGFAAVWASVGTDGSDEGIYLQMFKPNGKPTGAERLINTTTQGAQTHPDIARLKNGDLVVVWDSPDGGAEVGANIIGRVLNKKGQPSGDEFIVNTETAANQHNPAVTAFDDGGYLVSWTSPDADGFGAFAQRYAADGSRAGAEFQINTHSASSQFRPVVSEIDGGGFWAVWQSFNQDGEANGIYAQRFSQDNTLQGPEFLVNQTFLGDQNSADITTLANGRILITWQSTETQLDTDSYGIFGRFFDPASSASPLGDEFLINKITQGNQADASVTALPDGGFVVVWTDSLRDGNATAITLQRFDAKGVAVAASEVVNTFTTSVQSDAEVIVTAKGALVVSWTSFQQDGSAEGVYAQQFAPALYGTNANNRLVDQIGANWIDGRGGNDTLLGRGGKDFIKGGKGNDTLDGGAGKDVLTGGNGADRFVFKKKYGKDTVRDFRDDVDTIVLDDALWTGNLNKQQIINKFASVTGGDLVFDFGKDELKIKGFSDLTEIRDDLDII